MGRVSRGTTVIGILLGYLTLGVAQDKPADAMEVLREKLRADKKLVVATALDLTESVARRFWPVYNAYQSDMVAHYDRVLQLIESYARAYRTMTDESATKLLTEFLAIETNHVALMKSYVPASRGSYRPRRSRVCTRSRTRSGRS
jgi:hypothetical protein